MLAAVYGIGTRITATLHAIGQRALRGASNRTDPDARAEAHASGARAVFESTVQRNPFPLLEFAISADIFLRRRKARTLLQPVVACPARSKLSSASAARGRRLKP